MEIKILKYTSVQASWHVEKFNIDWGKTVVEPYRYVCATVFLDSVGRSAGASYLSHPQGICWNVGASSNPERDLFVLCASNGLEPVKRDM